MKVELMVMMELVFVVGFSYESGDRADWNQTAISAWLNERSAELNDCEIVHDLQSAPQLKP